jgi:hypothetical protein
MDGAAVLPLGRTVEQAAEQLSELMRSAARTSQRQLRKSMEACVRLRPWQARVVAQWLLAHAAFVAPDQGVGLALRALAHADVCSLRMLGVKAHAGDAGSEPCDVTLSQLCGILSPAQVAQASSVRDSLATVLWLRRLLAVLESLHDNGAAAAVTTVLILRTLYAPDAVRHSWLAFLIGCAHAVAATLRALGWAPAVSEAVCTIVAQRCSLRPVLTADAAHLACMLLPSAGHANERLQNNLCAMSGHHAGATGLAAAIAAAASEQSCSEGGCSSAVISAAMIAAQGAEEIHVSPALIRATCAAEVVSWLQAHVPLTLHGAAAVHCAVQHIVCACAMRQVDPAQEKQPTKPAPQQLSRLLWGLLTWAVDHCQPGAHLQPVLQQLTSALILAALELAAVQASCATPLQQAGELELRQVDHMNSMLREACAIGMLHLPLGVMTCLAASRQPVLGRLRLLRDLLGSSDDSVAPAACAFVQLWQAQLPSACLQQLLGMTVDSRSVLQAALDPKPGSAGSGVAQFLIESCLKQDATRSALYCALPGMVLPALKSEGPGRGDRCTLEWAVVVAAWSGTPGSLSQHDKYDWHLQLMHIVTSSGSLGHVGTAHAAQAALRCEVLRAAGGARAVRSPSTGASAAAEQLAHVLVASMLRAPRCVPVAVAAAAAAGEHACRALLAALLLGVQARVADATAGPLLLGDRPLHAALRNELPESLADAVADVEASAALHDAFIDAHLQMLCRTDYPFWRERAEALVAQLHAQADVVAQYVVDAEGAPPGAPAAPLALQPGVSAVTARTPRPRVACWGRFRDALWLRLQLLMPLLPIIYNDKSYLPSRNLRLRAASACMRMIAGTHVLRYDPAAPHVIVHADCVVKRLLLLVQTLLSDEWAGFVTCHNVKGRPQPVGEIMDGAQLVSMAEKMQLPPSAKLMLNSALLQDMLPAQWNTPCRWRASGKDSDRDNDVPFVTPQDPWKCAPDVHDLEVWNPVARTFEKAGCHMALTGAARVPASRPRFAFLTC